MRLADNSRLLQVKCEIWIQNLWFLHCASFFMLVGTVSMVTSTDFIAYAMDLRHHSCQLTSAAMLLKHSRCYGLQECARCLSINFFIRWLKTRLIGTYGWAIEWAYLQPPRPPNPQTGEVVNAPFQIGAKRLEINENVNRARLIRYFLAPSVSLENRSVFAKAPNECMQVEHNMSSCRAAWSPLWWWRCLMDLFQTIKYVLINTSFIAFIYLPSSC